MRRRRGFTLVELLIVVAIIALLVGIIAPSLTRAKELTRRTLCMNSLRCSGIALALYSEDQDGRLPPCGPLNAWSSHLFVTNAWAQYRYDLRLYLKPYVDDFRIWGCAAMGVAPIDHPANEIKGGNCYGTYLYFPGRYAPHFKTSRPVPNTTQELAAENWVMMQDFLALYKGTDWRATHSRGALSKPNKGNPSYMYKTGDPEGANLLMGTFSVRWYDVDELEDVGSNNGTGDKLVYSLAPQ